MNIILFGPPGSGKGTYSSRISPKLGIPHISTGDIFRAEVKAQTDLGKRVDPIMKAGKLVDDKTVIEIVEDRLQNDDAKNGYIFDGFPRTTEQAERLEDFTKIDIVINLVIPDDILLEKALARRVCKECGNIYNIASIDREGIKMPPLLPKAEGKCDKCGGGLIQRKDDNEQTIKGRLDLYKNQTQPLIEYYRNKGLLKDVKVIGDPEIMVPIIMKAIGK